MRYPSLRKAGYPWKIGHLHLLMHHFSALEDRYFLSSLSGNARHLLATMRTHWGIENDLHWTLDIAFREDDCRVRKDHADQNFAILRHIALNLLKQEKTAKMGVKARRLRAGSDANYLIRVLSGPSC